MLFSRVHSLGVSFFPGLLLVNSLSAFRITGAQGGIDSQTGARPYRYEISEFQKSGPAFDLFILAMSYFQETNQSDPLSYFQISGIHGFPSIPWDGVPGSGSYPGYCMHAATPFPTWHRPYLALFEQVLWTHAQKIANLFPENEREQYQAAAVTMRLPYWDWAIHPALPDVVTEPSIIVSTPTGRRRIKNPMFEYVFQSNATGNGFPSSHPLASLPTTVRWWNGKTQSSNQTAATVALGANAAAVLSLTYQLFTSTTNYTAFSCTWPGGQWITGNNVESIHNSIHNSVGGYGHMQYPEVAGFDPIFWLHHANVDRIFALWQALYPDSYITPTVNAYGSYYEPVGTVDSGTTGLAPFHSDEGNSLFDSDEVRHLSTFGYSYPELRDWDLTPDQLARNVRTRINTLYNPSQNITVTRSPRNLQKKSANYAQSFGHVTLDLARNLRVNNLDRQWSITILVDRYPTDTSFLIDFFMGEAPQDACSWATASNLVGTYAQFGPANVTALHLDGYPSGQVRGEILITHTLAAGVARGIIPNLLPRHVVPLLSQALNWKARTPSDVEVPLSALSGLSISVSSRSAVPNYARDEFPVYGALEWQGSVTEGKPCGAVRPHVSA